GVEDRVSVLVCDYRDVRGRWDKLVSLEMVESVGARHLDTFAAQWGRLLRRDGLMVVQAITTHDRLFRVDRHRRTFLTDLIFPGGCTPSLEAIIGSVARRTRLRVAAVYDITPHYPPTLQAWQDNLQANWPRIERLRGFDERFRRLWTLYFAYCAAGFLERRVQDRQIVLAGPDWRDENRLLGLAPDACGPPATAGRTTVR
ncbi:MAG TPA: class I SAM-dependent methyltransferase, partial [Candidatus Dormibacteraeota bacterium]|nr:class I SAM-dependent methyltransferase [Candidatus Dormibacteraeota bacterium]